MHKWTWPARLAYALTLVIIIGITLVIPQVGAQDDDDDGVCPYGQGFWRNTPEVWPVDQLTLGSQTYTQAELLALLDLPTTGDASLILARQLIAAKLNVANGSNGEIILATIAQMDALLATFEGRLPYDVAPSSSNGAAMVIAANTFDIFNQGVLSDDCEDDPEITPEASPEMTPESTLEATPEVTATPTPETTPGPEATPEATPDSGVIIVIEGPVVEININIIVIYDINIVIAPDDPVLTVIQIGDILRVEGVLEDDDDGLILVGDDDDDSATRITIVLVAINIVFVNIDVVIQDGVVWRDDGSCGNGPPPWAPAHGWRARCEQPQPGTIIIIDGDDDDDDGPGRGRGRGPRDDDDDD